jgi:hypothetical protein
VAFDGVDTRSLLPWAIDGDLFSFCAEAPQEGGLCTPRLEPYDHTSSLDCPTKLTERMASNTAYAQMMSFSYQVTTIEEGLKGHKCKGA